MTTWTTAIEVPAAGVRLDADVTIPHDARAMVLICYAGMADAPAARMLAEALQRHGDACVLLDLAGGPPGAAAMAPTMASTMASAMTPAAGPVLGPMPVGELADRLIGAVEWFVGRERLRVLPLGLLAVRAATPAALLAAAARPDAVRAVACVGGRADPAGPALPQVAAPTLLVVAEHDDATREIDQEVRNTMTAGAHLLVMAGATDLTGEPGTLLRVVDEVSGWFDDHLRG